MQRYYKRSREECFDADGWFHTGDLVRTDADGFVYFIGRRGAMIKTAGANVAPAEVEKAIAKVTGGVAAYVIGLPDPERGQVVVAVDRAPSGARRRVGASRRARSANCRPTRSPSGSSPWRRPQIPLLSSGKVDMQPARGGVRCLTPSTIDELVRLPRRHRHPDKPMVIDPVNRITYAELDATTHATWPRRSSTPASTRAPGSG